MTGCWTLLGARPLGSAPQVQFTFPVTLQIDGSLQSFVQPATFWAGVNVESLVPQEVLFMYDCASCAIGCQCNSSAFVVFEFEECAPACDGSVTITETDCLFSIALLQQVTNPSYQWLQSPSQNGTYVEINGATSDTYTGSHQQWYQLVVTDGDNGCIYYSNKVQADCPPPACSITVNPVVWNPVTEEFEVSWTATNGSGTYNWALYNYSNPNTSNCALSTGQNLMCFDTVAGTSDVCSWPLPAIDNCYYLVVYDAANPNCFDAGFTVIAGQPCLGSVTIQINGATQCTYQGVAFEDCNVPNGNLVTPFMEVDAFAPSACLVTEYSSNCIEGIFGQASAQYSGYCYWEIEVDAELKNALVSLGFLQLHISDTSTFLVNYNFPAGTPEGLSGPAGTVNPLHLGISLSGQSGSTTSVTVWADAIARYNANYLFNLLGLQLGTNFLGTNTLYSGLANGTTYLDGSGIPHAVLKLRFRNRHQPTMLWAGFKPNNVITVISTDQFVVTQNIYDTWPTGYITDAVTTECGDVGMAISWGNMNADPTTTMDNIVIAGVPFTGSIVTANPLTCGNGYTLSVQLNGISGPVFYLWSTGETTSTIIVDTADTYDVQVVDASTGCSYDDIVVATDFP
jgi:hypothetical protein